MLGADAGVIEPGRDGVGVHNLTGFIRHQIGPIAVENTGNTGTQWRRVGTGLQPMSTGFDAVHGHFPVIEKRVEQTDGVGATTDTGDQDVWQYPGLLQ